MTEASSGPAPQSGNAGQKGGEAALARAFVRLADTLASDFDVVDFLQGLSADSVEILGAEAAGVMLADGRGGLRLIASSDERMRLLELFELQGAQARAWTRSPRAAPCRRAQPAAASAGRTSPGTHPTRASR
jgi:hypothetical protein